MTSPSGNFQGDRGKQSPEKQQQILPYQGNARAIRWSRSYFQITALPPIPTCLATMAPSPKEFVESTLGPFLAGTFLNYLMVHFRFHLKQMAPQSLRCLYSSGGDRVHAALQLFSQVPTVLSSLNDLASSPLMNVGTAIRLPSSYSLHSAPPSISPFWLCTLSLYTNTRC